MEGIVRILLSEYFPFFFVELLAKFLLRLPLLLLQLFHFLFSFFSFLFWFILVSFVPKHLDSLYLLRLFLLFMGFLLLLSSFIDHSQICRNDGCFLLVGDYVVLWTFCFVVGFLIEVYGSFLVFFYWILQNVILLIWDVSNQLLQM